MKLYLWVCGALLSCVGEGRTPGDRDIVLNRYDVPDGVPVHVNFLKHGVVDRSNVLPEDYHKEGAAKQAEIEREMFKIREQQYAKAGQRSPNPRVKRFVDKFAPLWDDGIVPYRFANISSSQQVTVRQQMSLIENYTCVRFHIEGSGSYSVNHDKYLNFLDIKNRCYSYIGRQYAAQEISPCTHSLTTLHEIIHALGGYHEHSHNERDQHVQVNLQNVHKGYESNFDIPTYYNDFVKSPFDLQSLMLYQDYTFTKDFSLKTLDPYSDDVAATRDDYWNVMKELNIAYKCDASCSASHPACVNGGYMGLHYGSCGCICPDLLDSSQQCSELQAHVQGGIYNLSDSTPVIDFSTPGAPSSSISANTVYMWIFWAPEDGSKVVVDIESLHIQGTTSKCTSKFWINRSLIGQTGNFFCGDNYGQSIISLENVIVLKLEAGSASTSYLKGKATLKPASNWCYNLAERGERYDGTVDRAVNNKACLPWSQASNCEYYPANMNLQATYNNNYCRNPEKVLPQPWCYTSTSCEITFCDVCNYERMFDSEDNCASQLAQNSDFCNTAEAEEGCRLTCQLDNDAAPTATTPTTTTPTTTTPTTTTPTTTTPTTTPSTTTSTTTTPPTTTTRTTSTPTTTTPTTATPTTTSPATTTPTTTTPTTTTPTTTTPTTTTPTTTAPTTTTPTTTTQTTTTPTPTTPTTTTPTTTTSTTTTPSTTTASKTETPTTTTQTTTTPTTTTPTTTTQTTTTPTADVFAPIACVDGYTQFREDGLCYKYFNRRLNYYYAQRECSKQSADITSVETEQLQNFLIDLRTNARFEENSFRINARWSRRQSRWYWVPKGSSTTMAYTNWDSKSREGSAWESCAVIKSVSDGSEWKKTNCWRKSHFVCRKSAPAPQSTKRRRKRGMDLCQDEREECGDFLQGNPAMCTTTLLIRSCPATCGICNPDGMTCPVPQPELTDRVDLLTSAPTVTPGQAVSYQCQQSLVLQTGNLLRACTQDGSLTGENPVCSDISDTISSVNGLDLAQFAIKSFSKNMQMYGPSIYTSINRFGNIRQWSAYCKADGEVILMVFRQINSTSAKIIGMRKEQCMNDRTMRWGVPEHEGFEVQPGDFIGAGDLSGGNLQYYDWCDRQPNDNFGFMTYATYPEMKLKEGEIIEFGDEEECLIMAVDAVIIPW